MGAFHKEFPCVVVFWQLHDETIFLLRSAFSFYCLAYVLIINLLAIALSIYAFAIILAKCFDTITLHKNTYDIVIVDFCLVNFFCLILSSISIGEPIYVIIGN